ncbi:RagB/SusD family nutrient uptake outer membrane protein [termite gut metagenome]|uniref:RagB/SusD family nutrient uptake outer membrane protein n=1 Tax=termite gut metagenome TaxID=433724 RepID=A0A5J4R783_9ZZZZ
MKQNSIFILLGLMTVISCTDLNLNPLSEGSSGSWYSSQAEIEMSVMELYRDVFWPQDNDEWTDDMTNRDISNPISGATINGEWGTVTSLWTNSYKPIVRANTLIENMDRAANAGVSQATIDQYTAEAYFIRASKYADLISHFGGVPYVTGTISMDEAFKMGRSNVEELIPLVYKDFDNAIEKLPVSYSTSTPKRATKGAAMALKARFALYMGDWNTAAQAAKACMDLNIYKLHPNFLELFLTGTRNSEEAVFLIPRSISLNVRIDIRGHLPRNAGGWAQYDPSWDLLCAFLCTDGKPIDESPLFDPRRPFDNRDPRCAATIAPFEKEFLGYIYDPSPKAVQILNTATGNMQINNDSRVNAQYASFNGLVWRKGVDASWLDNGFTIDKDKMVIRYADVLLMYAEAKIELNQINQSVLEAINSVRARAYGVGIAETDKYPIVTGSSQTELRKIVRIERRMELAWETSRYMDLIRWKLAEKALNRGSYGMLDVADLNANVVDKGLWFFALTPEIDDDGLADFDPLYKGGYAKLLTNRLFDASRQYLWPIPSKEIIINSNIKQNPNY